MKKVDKGFMKVHNYIRNILYRKVCDYGCTKCRINSLCCSNPFFNAIWTPLFLGRWRTMSDSYRNELKNFIVFELVNENSLNKDIIEIFQKAMMSKDPDESH